MNAFLVFNEASFARLLMISRASQMFALCIQREGEFEATERWIMRVCESNERVRGCVGRMQRQGQASILREVANGELSRSRRPHGPARNDAFKVVVSEMREQWGQHVVIYAFRAGTVTLLLPLRGRQDMFSILAILYYQSHALYAAAGRAVFTPTLTLLREFLQL